MVEIKLRLREGEAPCRGVVVVMLRVVAVVRGVPREAGQILVCRAISVSVSRCPVRAAVLILARLGAQRRAAAVCTVSAL